MKRYFSVLVLAIAVLFAGNVFAADQAPASTDTTEKAPVKPAKVKSKTFKSKNKKKKAPVVTASPTPAPDKK